MTTAPFASSATPPQPPAPPPAAPSWRPASLRADSAIVGLGVALLAAAIVISTLYSRADGDLDWSTYAVGLVATIGLLVVGAGIRLTYAGADGTTDLSAWPMSFGAVGAGLMTGVALDDAAASAYVAGLLVLALAAVAYVLSPSAPPVVAAVLGLLLVYAQTLDDTGLVDTEDEGFIQAAVAVAVFVLLVSAVAWFLPGARVVVGVAAGAVAVAAYLALMAAIAFASLFAGFASFDPEATGPPEEPSYDNDVYVILALATLLVAAWLVAAYLTDAPGFRLVGVAMVASVLPAGMAVLAVEHPSVWALVVGVLGGAALVLVAVRARAVATQSRPTPPAQAGPTSPPPPPYAG
ncbi:hypothetical protein FE634_00280 [Nocardioides dongxiaopingii]|uniref:hypothetical protein n=1 Tax=Nocardioides sp. S-1144 TaxID=2582905 RepID=UPI00110F03E8|nr:hypothetical protein [Nocardioides sp. S-1144]QCW49239.1 hypothetical protein FE634_00280 [Nocardioides sp. S-1144]